jgi:glycosyltransferase involved in cell wall biosynthesis
MKIAFISTRGIPNNYGGFEQFAEYISIGLAARGHEVTVYSPHFHPYQNDKYNGVNIKHIYSPESWMGNSTGSFVYDFLSLKDALQNERFDIIYVTGYTSIVPAYIWFRINKIKYPAVITNMDGLEYKRTKFNRLVRIFLGWEEKVTARYSHYLVADNMGIKDYIREKFSRDSQFLAYGANIYDNYDARIPKEFGLKPNQYCLLVARLEPENNIEMIIQGYLASKQKEKPLVIVGKTGTPYGKYLTKKYVRESSIRFVGGIYEFDKLNSIRYFSHIYFHGHSVGGTNPSLLEAMASECFIFAHDNKFNRTVLNDNARYFSTVQNIVFQMNEIAEIMLQYKEKYIAANLKEIREKYSWEKLIDEHEKYFFKIFLNK